MSKRTEGNGGAGAGGNDPRRGGSLLLRPSDGLSCQTGFAYACGAGKDDAGLPPGKNLGQIGEFGLASEQRPSSRHARLGRSSRWGPPGSAEVVLQPGSESGTGHRTPSTEVREPSSNGSSAGWEDSMPGHSSVLVLLSRQM